VDIGFLKKAGLIFLLSSGLMITLTAQETRIDGAEEDAAVFEEPVEADIFTEAEGKILRWQINPGEVVEIKKFTNQWVTVTENKKTENVERNLIDRIVLIGTEKDPDMGYGVNGNFYSMIRYGVGSGTLYEENETDYSSFHIDPRGRFTVDKDLYMPNLRNFPVFPEKRDPAPGLNRLMQGETWSIPAEEIFKADTLIHIPYQVKYEYLGEAVMKIGDERKRVHKIGMNIEVSFNFPPSAQSGTPMKMFGYGSAVMVWDEAAFIPLYLREEYNLMVTYPENLTHEFVIHSKTYYKKLQDVEEREKISQKIIEEVQNDGDIRVDVKPEGISLSIPDILFEKNSSKLDKENKAALDKVITILKKYPEKNLLVRGHTDTDGTYEYNKELSTDRARTVAEYILQMGGGNVDQLSYEGISYDEPVADNSTPEGRGLNRRVEIILLHY